MIVHVVFYALNDRSNHVLKHPLVNDMLFHGAHPFPSDMEGMLQRIHAHDPTLLDNLDSRYFPSWQAGQDLNAGRSLLRAIEAYVLNQGAKS